MANIGQSTLKRRKIVEHTLCTRCSKVDFEKLFSEPVTYQMGRVESAYQNTQCPLCQLVVQMIDRSYNNLHLAAKIPYRDMINKGVEYKMYSYAVPKDEHLKNDVATFFRCAIDLGHRVMGSGSSGKWSQWKAHSAPKPDADLEVMAFDLTNECLSHIKQKDKTNMIRRPVPQSLDIRWLRECLSTCDKSHFHMRKILDRFLPEKEDNLFELRKTGRFRVIDVTQSKVVSLVDSKLPRYFALSYVWGKTMSDFAARSDPDQDQDIPTEWGLDVQQMPQVIKDAMELLQRLGESYLWVDAICIVQSNQKDKQTIIEKMGDIYNYAYATIVAASGDSSVGLTRIHESDNNHETPCRFAFRGHDVSLLPSRLDIETLLKKTSMNGKGWNGRGWTYQERLLSQRCIFFLKDEIICDCSNRVAREAYYLEDPTSLPKESKPRRPLPIYDKAMELAKFDWQDFKESVCEYSNRTLGKPGDRLNAFVGAFESFIARDPNIPKQEKVQPVVSSWTLCGLPQAWFHWALLWGPKHSLDDKTPDRIETDTWGERCLPTWSWVGWNCPIEFTSLFTDGPAACDVKHMNDFNIALGPIKKRKYDPHLGWSPWPYNPEACETDELSRVTLHIWVPVVRCRLSYSKAYGWALMVPADGELVDFEHKVGFVGNESWAKGQPEGRICEIVVLPISRVELITPAFMIKRQGDFAERVPTPIMGAMREVIKGHMEYEHIRLR